MADGGNGGRSEGVAEVAVTGEVGLGGYGRRNRAQLGWEMKNKWAR
jgi:hypothetical protein